MSRAPFVVAAATAVTLLGAALVGCPGAGFIDYQGCEFPDDDPVHLDPWGNPDPCHCTDDGGPPTSAGTLAPSECMRYKDGGMGTPAEGPIPGCTGECLPLQPIGWSPPALLWTGVETEAPACPDYAPIIGYEGYADLDAPLTCGACACDAPTGACALPATIAANGLTCMNTTANTLHTPFDPPSGWDGSCTTHDAIPKDAKCFGVNCVNSLTIAPPILDESACPTFQQPVPLNAPSTWKTYGRACIGVAHGGCADPGELCVASATPRPAGFLSCIFHEGDVACPINRPYVDRHVLYGGFDDARECGPCSCGAPEGSKCSATLSVFSDGTCASPYFMSLAIDSTAPRCVDLAAGSALGSKSASAPIYEAGACQASGGEPTGTADPILPGTFCCLPS